MASPVSRNTFGACFLYFLPRHYNGTTILGWCIIKQGNKHEKKHRTIEKLLGMLFVFRKKTSSGGSDVRCQFSRRAT